MARRHALVGNEAEKASNECAEEKSKEHQERRKG